MAAVAARGGRGEGGESFGVGTADSSGLSAPCIPAPSPAPSRPPAPASGGPRRRSSPRRPARPSRSAGRRDLRGSSSAGSGRRAISASGRRSEPFAPRRPARWRNAGGSFASTWETPCHEGASRPARRRNRVPGRRARASSRRARRGRNRRRASDSSEHKATIGGDVASRRGTPPLWLTSRAIGAIPGSATAARPRAITEMTTPPNPTDSNPEADLERILTVLRRALSDRRLHGAHRRGRLRLLEAADEGIHGDRVDRLRQRAAEPAGRRPAGERGETAAEQSTRVKLLELGPTAAHGRGDEPAGGEAGQGTKKRKQRQQAKSRRRSRRTEEGAAAGRALDPRRIPEDQRGRSEEQRLDRPAGGIGRGRRLRDDDLAEAVGRFANVYAHSFVSAQVASKPTILRERQEVVERPVPKRSRRKRRKNRRGCRCWTGSSRWRSSPR